MTQNEGRIELAMQAIKLGQFQNVQTAAKAYNVPRKTLFRRLNGVPSRASRPHTNKNLTELEEEVLIEHILDLDARGFAPNRDGVRKMANELLAIRAGDPVGLNWVDNFIKRTPALKKRRNRRKDYQRAKCEDPELIKAWFRLVRRTIAKYGIIEDDIYNFDETGFQMGVISANSVVITGSERRNRPQSKQPGNREWVTAIETICASGWALPPFLVLSGAYHLQAWFEEDLPGNWMISLSENGWSNDEIGFQWLEHFDKCTKSRLVGAKRLLVVDGHGSHHTFKFGNYCKANGIITLCMPPHSSHILQPLDVGLFSPLKVAYGRQLEGLIRNHINHVTKTEFLPAFCAARAVFSESSIRGGFRGAGIVPLNPETVISKLDIRPILLPSSPPEQAPWESRTPQNVTELDAQNALIQTRIDFHMDSSPTPIKTALNKLVKGAQKVIIDAALMQQALSELQSANQLISARRKRSKRRIQKGGALSVAAGKDLIAETAIEAQLQSEMRQNGGQGCDGSGRISRCKTCKQTGHNKRTCPKERETLQEQADM